MRLPQISTLLDPAISIPARCQNGFSGMASGHPLSQIWLLRMMADVTFDEALRLIVATADRAD